MAKDGFQLRVDRTLDVDRIIGSPGMDETDINAERCTEHRCPRPQEIVGTREGPEPELFELEDLDQENDILAVEFHT